jgi:WD40 repeat protein
MRLLFLPLMAVSVSAWCAENGFVSYERHIAPIFRNYCAGCHNDRQLEAKLSLETFAQLRHGGEDHGDPIIPGDPEESFIVKAIEGRARPKMPPKDQPPVSESDLRTLRQWIKQGAPGPVVDQSILRTLVAPEIPPAPVTSPWTAVAYSRDARRVVFARTGALEMRETDSNKLIRAIDGLAGKVNAVHFSPDGTLLAVASGLPGLHGVAQLHDSVSGDRVRELGEHADVLYDAEFSPDGQWLATAGYDRVIHLWRVKDGTLERTIDVHKGAVFDLAWHPHEAILASASADETVKLWRVTDGLRMDTLNQPQAEVVSVVFTPDGNHILAAGADKRIYLWRFVAREGPAINPMLHARFAHESAIHGLALSSDGRYLLSSADDRTLKLWSVPNLELLHTYGVQSDVATAMAAVPSQQGFFVARADGTSTQVAIELTETARETASDPVAVAHNDGVTESSFSRELEEFTETEPNHEPASANPAGFFAQVRGTISAPGDVDCFRFTAQGGQVIALEVNAARSESRLDSVVEVLHANGEPVPQVVLQATRDSWLTFRGKDSATAEDFRLHNWAEMELNEYLYVNGEVVRLWLYPRGPDSGFKIYPGEGKRHTYFSTSPLVHAMGQPCYTVTPLPAGSDPAPNGLPVFHLNYTNDDDPSRRLGTDSFLLFTAPDDGEYLARVSDVRGFGSADGYHYTLSIRPPRPDFAITMGGKDPKVSHGSGREITFKAERREGFEGPIRIDMDDLPPGFTASTPVEIEPGQFAAVAVLSAAPDAVNPDKSADDMVKITATAMINGREITHELGTLGDIQVGPPAKVTVEILPSEDRSFVRETENGRLEFSLRPGETFTAKVRATRHDFDGRIELGGEDSGRNLPHGVYVDNIGLNGLLIVEGQVERDFFITASRIAAPGTRLFHLRANADGGQASLPAWIRILPPSGSAAAHSASAK